MPPNFDSTSISTHEHCLNGEKQTNAHDAVSTDAEDDAALELLKATVDAVPCRGYVCNKVPTPIEHMPRLSAMCYGPQLYVKRDDLLPLAGGGSKTRKLDYLVQEAIDEGADVLVTSGAVQSNHCRLTASAAAREGLECCIVLEERVEGSYNPKAGGNNYIFALLGAKQIPAPLGGVGPVQDELVAKLQAEGKKVYVIPGGGSNELGALGYARASAEIIDKSKELKAASGEADKPGLYWDAIVACSGSGGTHTGLLCGLRAAGLPTPVLGISVRFDSDKQARRIQEQCDAFVTKYFPESEFFPDGRMPESDVIVLDNEVGPGYSLPTDSMAEAIKAFARLESIILDPVYTGKGAAGLLSVSRSGRFTKDQRILFVHTGGAPSLFHYQTLPGDVSLSNEEETA